MLLLFGVSISFVAGEVACRYLLPGFQKIINSNSKLKDYGDVCVTGGIAVSGYLKPNFNNYVTNEFGKKIRWINNSLGFRYDKEISLKPKNGVVRILSLGDSYTVGYRISQKAIFSSLLEKYFNSKSGGQKHEFLPANISEPNFGLLYLSNFGIKLKPDFVFLGITLGNDVFENYTTTHENCGYILTDQFSDLYRVTECVDQPFIDSKCLLPKKVKAESNISILDYSMLYRTLHGYFSKYQGEVPVSFVSWDIPKINDLCLSLGINLKEPPDEINKAYEKLYETLNKYKNLSLKHNFRFVVVIFPQRIQVQREDWLATLNRYGLDATCFDLMKPNDLILKFCNKSSILCLDPTPQLISIYEKKGRSLYLPLGDMHWNALGHRALFDSVKEQLYEIISKSQ